MQTAPARVRTHIRWMIRRDFPSVLPIEAAGFAEPKDEAALLAWLRERHIIGMVAEDPAERVVGFMIYGLRKGSIEVLDFAVHPDSRRRGVGLQMVNKLIGKLSPGRRTTLVVDVPEACASVGFWAEMGFKAGLVRSWTAEPDTYRFTYTIEAE